MSPTAIRRQQTLGSLIFLSRRLQAPLGLGLIMVIIGGCETFVSRLNLACIERLTAPQHRGRHEAAKAAIA
jgi:uncharacterized membrane protein YqhA